MRGGAERAHRAAEADDLLRLGRPREGSAQDALGRRAHLLRALVLVGVDGGEIRLGVTRRAKAQQRRAPVVEELGDQVGRGERRVGRPQHLARARHLQHPSGGSAGGLGGERGGGQVLGRALDRLVDGAAGREGDGGGRVVRVEHPHEVVVRLEGGGRLVGIELVVLDPEVERLGVGLVEEVRLGYPVARLELLQYHAQRVGAALARVVEQIRRELSHAAQLVLPDVGVHAAREQLCDLDGAGVLDRGQELQLLVRDHGDRRRAATHHVRLALAALEHGAVAAGGTLADGAQVAPRRMDLQLAGQDDGDKGGDLPLSHDDIVVSDLDDREVLRQDRELFRSHLVT
mmetsp:Transcript_31615/g.93118  ORF Transcript_31615/g.93118 Transcript_31615/m.93118 type:complete len:345 (+) Transcript_31615:868-1902(+)